MATGGFKMSCKLTVFGIGPVGLFMVAEDIMTHYDENYPGPFVRCGCMYGCDQYVWYGSLTSK